MPIVVAGPSQSAVPVRVSDFTAEVNHQPVTIASVTSLSGRHLQYELIYDARLHTDWDDELHVAKELLKLVITPGFDTGTLVSYGELVLLGSQNGRDPRKLASEVGADRISPARLYDAIADGTSWLVQQQSGSDERKVVFLVCDGKDTGSQVDLAAAVRALQKVSIPLFALAPSYLEKRKEGQYMRELSEQSGGRVYFLPRSAKLTLDDLKRDLKNSILLTLNLPSEKGLLPLKITNAAHPESPILSPAYVFVP
ncbi:MAG TPA: hypothetical protein VK466_08680 [Terriglobales bacterium]|nr:hypothetical protein [Terriglobales bacterium]